MTRDNDYREPKTSNTVSPLIGGSITVTTSPDGAVKTLGTCGSVSSHYTVKLIPNGYEIGNIDTRNDAEILAKALAASNGGTYEITEHKFTVTTVGLVHAPKDNYSVVSPS